MLETIVFTAIFAFPAGVLVGRYLLPRARKAPEHPRVYHARGESRPALQFGFTLNGEQTGEVIPFGKDPGQAARERSEKEGKPYGARRI